MRNRVGAARAGGDLSVGVTGWTRRVDASTWAYPNRLAVPDSRRANRVDRPGEIPGRRTERVAPPSDGGTGGHRVASRMRFFTTRPGTATLARCKPVSAAVLRCSFRSGRRLQVPDLQQSGSKEIGRAETAGSASGAPKELTLANSHFKKVWLRQSLQSVAFASAIPGLPRGYLSGRGVLSDSLARRRRIGEVAVGRVG